MKICKVFKVLTEAVALLLSWRVTARANKPFTNSFFRLRSHFAKTNKKTETNTNTNTNREKNTSTVTNTNADTNVTNSQQTLPSGSDQICRFNLIDSPKTPGSHKKNHLLDHQIQGNVKRYYKNGFSSYYIEGSLIKAASRFIADTAAPPRPQYHLENISWDIYSLTI